jgi:hypothetical protein
VFVPGGLLVRQPIDRGDRIARSGKGPPIARDARRDRLTVGHSNGRQVRNDENVFTTPIEMIRLDRGLARQSSP